MSSAWPPELKTWVQDCLSKATPSNKNAVNSELKQILFQAHKDGSFSSTDWTKVELQTLKAQQLRITHITPAPVPRPTVQPIYVPQAFPQAKHSQVPASSLTSVKAPIDDGRSAGKKKNKKQKKNDGSAKSTFPTPYYFVSNVEEEAALARRAARFSVTRDTTGPIAAPVGVSGWFGGDDDAMDGGTAPGQVGKLKMKGKGGLGYGGIEVVEVDPNVIDWDSYTIRGTSSKLEKSYLRLTSEPSPADIRPLEVLKQTLLLLKKKWKNEHNYKYAVDQFKSMRQDLTVQRIKNEFTVEVYEIHARIALEAKDLGEYNQCQSMLRQLYELGIKGHPLEFLSYRIIYLLHTRNRSDMAALLAQLTPFEKSDPGVAHALQVHASLATSNYVRFFRLFNTAPNMSGYIMDHFIERERMSALSIMSKAYLTLPMPHLTSTLAFESDSETDAFLSAHSAAAYKDEPAPVTNNAHWKPIKRSPPKPLHERVWDCKLAHAACAAGLGKYRVVDLKGQLN